MKRNLAKVIAVFIALFLLTGIISGCKGKGSIIDLKRTQLYVMNYDGGVGTEWLYAAVEKFEQKYKDVEFEPGTGKKGVQVIVDPVKLGSDLINTIQNSENEVFFTESVKYFEFVSQGLIADITDIVAEEELEEEGVTIESKIPEYRKNILTAFDGKYYALPHYEIYRGINYDIDLFRERNLYFAHHEVPTAEKYRFTPPGGKAYYFVIDENTRRSVGPDGLEGTDDDGLPATHEEFFALMDYMVSLNITPFVWTGQYLSYTTIILDEIYYNYEGYDKIIPNFLFEGKIDTVTGFNGDEPIIENIDIGIENGYKIIRQPGRYYAIRFLEKILSNPNYYYSFSLNNTFSHLDAQEQFIYGKLEQNPVAFLVDGSYFINEAKDAIARSIKDFGDVAKNRNYGWMPIPSFVNGTSQDVARIVEEEDITIRKVVKDTLNAYAFINANINNKPEKLSLAKLFLKFCYSDEMLKEFTAITGVPRGVDYSLTNEQFNKLTTYQKTIWNMRQNADAVIPNAGTEFFIRNGADLPNLTWTTIIGGQSYALPINAIRDNKSAKDIFLGLKGYNENDWINKYQQWID